jgi:hypothetical protein
VSFRRAANIDTTTSANMEMQVPTHRLCLPCSETYRLPYRSAFSPTNGPARVPQHGASLLSPLTDIAFIHDS